MPAVTSESDCWTTFHAWVCSSRKDWRGHFIRTDGSYGWHRAGRQPHDRPRDRGQGHLTDDKARGHWRLDLRRMWKELGQIESQPEETRWGDACGGFCSSLRQLWAHLWVCFHKIQYLAPFKHNWGLFQFFLSGVAMRCSVTPATASHLTSQLPPSSPTLQESPPPVSFVKSVIRSSRRSRVWRCTNRQSTKEWSSTASSALTVRQPSQTWKCTFRRNTPLPNQCTSNRSQPEPFNISKKLIWETMLLTKSIALWDKVDGITECKTVLGIWTSFVSHCILEAKMSNSFWNFLKLLLMQQQIWLFVSISSWKSNICQFWSQNHTLMCLS